MSCVLVVKHNGVVFVCVYVCPSLPPSPLLIGWLTVFVFVFDIACCVFCGVIIYTFGVACVSIVISEVIMYTII